MLVVFMLGHESLLNVISLFESMAYPELGFKDGGKKVGHDLLKKIHFLYQEREDAQSPLFND